MQTALAQIAAEELDFPFDQLDRRDGHHLEDRRPGPDATAAWTVRYAGPQIRHAAAAGRQALLDLASQRISVPVEQLAVARGGSISVVGSPDRTDHLWQAGGRQAPRHGDRRDRQDVRHEGGAQRRLEGSVDLHRRRPVGAAQGHSGQVSRASSPMSRTSGSPNMLHGRVVRPYGIEARLLSVDESGLQDIPGFMQVVRRGATSWASSRKPSGARSRRPRSWARCWSRRGRTHGQAKWSDLGRSAGDERPLGNGCADRRGKDIIGGQPWPRSTLALRDGAENTQGNLSHAIRNPWLDRPVLADRRCGRVTRNVLGRHPDAARGAARHGRAARTFRSKTSSCAGSRLPARYGRNGLEPVIADAAIMSQAVGRPVRVQWMRWDEHGWEPKEPPIVQDLAGRAGRDAGNVTAWRHHMWVPTLSDTRLLAAELIGKPDVRADRTG